LCDSGISIGWYKFGGDAGTQLSTTCVPRKYDLNNLKCRTHAVSWLNGTHPSMSDGKVTRTVYFSWDGNCRYGSKNIEVINCGFFYIYKLGPTNGCHLRYCGIDV
jgi:uromodulin